MTAVLNSLGLETLEELYYHDDPHAAKDEKKKLKKKDIVDAISDKIDTYAIEVFIASLPLAQLKTVAEKAKAQFNEKDNKNSRSVLSRRLAEQVVSAGFDEFLDTVDADTLKAVAEDFDVKADKKAIAEAARNFAAERYFGNFDVESLRALAEELKLKQAAKTSSKRKLVEAIVTQEDAEPVEAPKKKKQKTDVGKKKALEKGITYDEIFQHYYVEELRDFVKSKGIKVSGKKPVLIKRILAYLAGETEGIMAGDKTEKAKKKKKATTKKAAASKKGAAATSAKGKGKKEEKKEENGNGDE
jgi:hypothetical protein